jgi:hypothetical protein
MRGEMAVEEVLVGSPKEGLGARPLNTVVL